jgi:hypothetical protein
MAGSVDGSLRWGVTVRYPVDLPKGYHTSPRKQSLAILAGGRVEGCLRGDVWLGVARSTGYRTDPA